MRILVTGATSMVGLAVEKRLLLDGHEVIAVARRKSEKLLRLSEFGKIETVLCDMNEYASISEKISGTIDVAFLTAWNGTRGLDRDNAQVQKDNYLCNKSVLPELLKLNCKKILTSGSQAEYGNWTSAEKLKESNIPMPNTEYGKQKLHFFEECKLFCERNQICVIEPRFFSLYGPDDFSGTLIMSTLEKMMKNLPCEMTECKQRWNYLYIDDAVSGVDLLITKDVPSGVYNFGFNKSFTLKHYVETMYRITGSHSQLLYGSIPYPKGGIAHVDPDVSKLMSLGWKPEISFEMGIQRIIESLQSK